MRAKLQKSALFACIYVELYEARFGSFLGLNDVHIYTDVFLTMYIYIMVHHFIEWCAVPPGTAAIASVCTCA